MTIIADPNWLSVASAAFVLGGLWFLAKGVTADPSGKPDDAAQRLARATRTVDFGVGLPLVMLGALFNVIGQLVQLPFNWIATALMLTLAYVLLLYLAIHDLIVDRMLAQRAPKQRVAAKIALLPSPVSEAREVSLDARSAELAAQS